MNTATAELAIESGHRRVADCIRERRSGWAPPPDLTVSEFSDCEIRVTSGPRAGTHWDTDFAPYQRGILDAFHEPDVEHVVVKGSSQWGKTACLVNIVAYHIAHDPCPILVVEPTEDPMAKDFSKNRLDPVIEASPILNDAVGKKRAKGQSNTTLMKTFRGGYVALAGASSAASLAARSIRVLCCDEIDRYPRELSGEGSTISIVLKRTLSYGPRRRVIFTSSPTIVDAPIDAWFKRGDQRHYHVPCPSCGVMHKYEWKNVKWDDGDPTTARLECPECGYEIDDLERIDLLADGEWVPENPDRLDQRIVSFHMWEAYSPMSSLQDIVSDFLEARKLQKAGDPGPMHTWQNTTLGEAYAPKGDEKIDTAPLLERREDYGECDVPGGACLLTMGVDTQDDRLEYVVTGWGPGMECWFVDRDILPGDPLGPEPWEMLDDVLAHEYLHECGVRLGIACAFVDSAGHRTDAVYDYCYRRAARRVFASIGGRQSNLPIVRSPSMPRKRTRGGRKVPLYTVGVDQAKGILMSMLKKPIPREGESWDGFVHLPNREWADEEFVAQLTSERLETKWEKGIPTTQWVKTRARNEALDCWVLNLAALRRLNPDLKALAKELGSPRPTKKAKKREPFMPRRRGWMKNR